MSDHIFIGLHLQVQKWSQLGKAIKNLLTERMRLTGKEDIALSISVAGETVFELMMPRKKKGAKSSESST